MSEWLCEWIKNPGFSSLPLGQGKSLLSTTPTFISVFQMYFVFYATCVRQINFINQSVKHIEGIRNRQWISREWVTATTQRVPPRQWGKFAAASLAIKIRQSEVPVNVHANIFNNTFTQNRKQGRLFGYDSLQKQYKGEPWQKTGSHNFREH